MRCPSTTGAAHRCRRPSLGYPTPFDCVWSRRRTALRLFDALSRLSDALRRWCRRTDSAIRRPSTVPSMSLGCSCFWCPCILLPTSSGYLLSVMRFSPEILLWRWLGVGLTGVSVSFVLLTSPSLSVSPFFLVTFFLYFQCLLSPCIPLYFLHPL